MTNPVNKESADFEDIQLLTFNIGRIRIGADVSQIAEMLEYSQAVERGLKIRKFSEEISFRAAHMQYASPKVLLIKHGGNSHGIVIDRPEDIISVGLDSIRALPHMVSCCSETKAIWGIAVHKEDIILLVDFYKFGILSQPDNLKNEHKSLENKM